MMSDENRTREQLLDELATLRGRVAELETATAEQEKNTSLLQTIFDGTAAPVMLIGTDYQVKLMNRRTREEYGVGEKPGPYYCYQVSHDRDSPCDGAAHLCPLLQVQESLCPVTVVHEHFKPDGEVCFIEIIASPVLDEAGMLTGVIETFRDITERKQAEAALAEERNLLRTLIDNMPDFINIKDAESRFVVANTATAHQLGVATPGDVLGKTDFDFHAPELAEAYYAREQRIIRSGQPEINFEEFYVDQATGAERWALFSKVPLQDRHGVITGIMNIGRDITERKQAEEARERYAERLRVLRQIDRAILAAQSPQEIVQAALGHMRQLVSCQRASVALFDFEAGQGTVLAVHVNGETSVGSNMQMPLDAIDIDDALWAGEAQVVEDVRALSDPSPLMQRLRAEGIQSYIGAPLIVQEQLIGALYLGAEVANAFRPEHVDIARDVAAQLSVAFQSVRLSEQAQDEIAERKQTEAALTEERNLLRTLIESLPSLVYVKDTESRFILANGRTEEFMGAPLKGLIGKTDFDFHPQEMAAEFYADEQAIIESGEPMLDKDEPNVDSAGNMRWYLVTKSPLRDSHGETVGLVGINRDITERKRAEEKLRRLNDELEQRVAERTAELRAEKEQTETILQNVADAIVLTDLNAEILYVNPAWEHLTGYSAAEAFNQNPRILQSGKTGSQVYIAMWGTVLAGETWRGILRNRRKDGTDYEAELTVAPVHDERGEIHYFVGIQRDVTEEQQLADMKEQFVADAAHDLSNPVAVLKTYLYLLKKAPEQLAERLPILEYQINRLANLIADLLNLSCLDRGMVEMDFVPLDLSAIVGLIVEAQRPLAHQKGQALIFEAEPNVPLILADAQQIGRVVVNLVANALNYTPEGGEVVARISQARDGVVLTVRDTGIGIGPDDLPLIFERFYRSDEAKASGQGTGLGLSIAEKIVEAHQGRIEVESVPGVGSAFRVILPVSENWKDGT